MSTTDGISAVYLESRNWGKSARFFQALGYELEFETDHNSGRLRNGNTPPVFVAEVPEDRPARLTLVLEATSEKAVLESEDLEVVTAFEDTHYGAREATVRDPDGRLWVLQAPTAE